MRKHLAVEEARTVAKQLAKHWCPDSGNPGGQRIRYWFDNFSLLDQAIRLASDGLGWASLGVFGMDPWHGVVGSFSGDWTLRLNCSSCEGILTVFLGNQMTAKSATWKFWRKYVKNNPLGPGGPLRTINMTWTWEEVFDIPTGTELSWN